MSFGLRYAIALIALLLLAFVAYLARPRAPVPAADVMKSQLTLGGLYSASIEPEVPEIRQGELHSWILTVKTAAGQPVDDAKVLVDGGMPAHRHGLPTSPAASASLGDGRYRIEGVKFSMSGHWELRFDISSSIGEDEVTFDLVL
jgi:hypothetical protein